MICRDKSGCWKMLIVSSIILLLILGLVSPIKAFNSNTIERLDHFLEEAASKMNIPGLGVAVGYQGEIVYSRVIGRNISAETRFFIGSISKPFTAHAVMQLVEQGKVNLDESVSSYIEGFDVSDEITVRHLLQHLSGMTEFEYKADLPVHYDLSQLAQDINSISLQRTPGEDFNYFNQNYSLLGLLIERVSGETYEQYMENNVFVPLNLSHTSAHGDVDTPGHLSLFGFSFKRQEPFIKYDLPAGFISSTAEDLVRYLESLRTVNAAVGLSSQAIAEMMTGSFYGMGWMIGKIADRPAVFHGGSLPGYAANAIIFPEDEYSIAWIVNKSHMLNEIVFYPDLTNGLAAILLGEEPVTKFNLIWIVRLLMILLVVTFVVKDTRKMIRLVLSPWQMTQSKRIRALFVNLAIPIALLHLIPVLVAFVFRRAMTWKLAFFQMPDLVGWMFIGIGFNLLEACIHLVHLVKTHIRSAYLEQKIK